METPEDTVWETARLRANLASGMLSLYRSLSSAGSKPAETGRLRANVARAREELEKTSLASGK
jgi:hypothetical protein